MICPICGRMCLLAESIIEIVNELTKNGYKRNYTILCEKVGEGRFRAAKKVYRVDFANPRIKHIILINPRSTKTDATRAKRVELKKEHLRKAGWKVSTLSSILCR